jgi:hypothetical protein
VLATWDIRSENRPAFDRVAFHYHVRMKWVRLSNLIYRIQKLVLLSLFNYIQSVMAPGQGTGKDDKRVRMLVLTASTQPMEKDRILEDTIELSSLGLLFSVAELYLNASLLEEANK